jgi:hypothetical protein
LSLPPPIAWLLRKTQKSNKERTTKYSDSSEISHPLVEGLAKNRVNVE